MQNIPNQQISGLCDEELNWVTEQSGDRYMAELSEGFLSYLNNEEKEDISEELLAELEKMETDSIPNSTQKQMDNTIRRFRSFLIEKKLSTDFGNIPIRILDNYLRYFFSELRTKDGKYYAPASLVCFRAAIHRYFLLIRSDIYIIGDIRFRRSHQMLKAMVAKYKKSGQTKPEETYPVIEYEDLRKLKEYFDRMTAEHLQDEVIFNFLFYLGLRGRETLPYLTKESIICEKSSTGRKYLRICHEILSKNARASLDQKEFEDLKKARIYEDKNNKSQCPVEAWNLYLDQIKDSEYLFPAPTNVKSKKAVRWFTPKRKIGKNKLDCFLSKLSEKLQLSKRYTNHCTRVTLVTMLKEQGFSNADVCEVTGHKNPSSIDRYNKRRRDTFFEDVATSLEPAMSGKELEITNVGKKARIITVNEPAAAETTKGCEIHFNGSFSNCSFNIYKN